MRWCHVCEDGTVDWTSDVEQEGLVYLDLPLVNYGESLLYRDGEFVRQATADVSATISEQSLSDTLSGLKDLVLSLSHLSPHETLFRLGDCSWLRTSSSGHPISPEDVTVLIPCYKKARWVMDTVRSVLDQTVLPKSIYILLMDEESQALKDTLELMSPIVRCECHDRLDVVRVRNYLADLCPTEYFTFLDADDLLASDFFEKCLSDGADFILSPFIHFASESDADVDLHSPLSGNLTGVYRRSSFWALGGLDTSFSESGHEDTDFLVRLAAHDDEFSVRLEMGTCYRIRRCLDPLWVESSFVESAGFSELRDKAFELLYEKHSNFLKRLVYSSLDFPPFDRLIINRFFSDGDLSHLEFVVSSSIISQDVFLDYLESVFGLFNVFDFFSVGSVASEGLEFDGDWSKWKFINCAPTKRDLSLIEAFCLGRKVDVVCLGRGRFSSALSVSDALRGEFKALVRADLDLDGLEGLALYKKLARDTLCVSFPFYSLSFSDMPFFHQLDFSLFADTSLSLLSTPQFLSSFNLLLELKSKEDAYISKYSFIHVLPYVSFELHKVCNAFCPYCCQSLFSPASQKFSDDEMFERFCRAVEFVEALYGDFWVPQITGGEPTLWSGDLIDRVMSRLSMYPYVEVFTNHLISDSAWEKYPQVSFLSHVTDWHGAGRIEIPAGDVAVIVVTHEDMPYLEDFLCANVGNQDSLYRFLYRGTDERFVLTDDDRREILRLEVLYGYRAGDLSDTLSDGTSLGTDVDFSDISIDSPLFRRIVDSCRKDNYMLRFDCEAGMFYPCCFSSSGGVPFDTVCSPQYSDESCLYCVKTTHSANPLSANHNVFYQ